jgi:uroporphyrinogen decarboxylase
MNGRQRIEAALRGEKTDRTPVMLHNFMMAAREAGISMKQYRESPEAIARAFTMAVDRYGYDAVVVDIDTVTLAAAVGVPVDEPEDLPARSAGRRLNALEEVADLPPPDIGRHRKVQVSLEAVRLLRHQFGAEIFVRGNCDQAPFSLACAMRGMEDWLLEISGPENEPRAHALLAYATDATCQFLRLMAAAGADMLSNGDSPAGPDVISPKMYRQFALPYEKRAAACAHSLGLPYLQHICGKTDRILKDMISSGADALELDYKTDVRLARDAMRDKATFAGNIDPSGVLALGTPDLVRRKTHELLTVFSGPSRFILNAGCAIPADTPSENLRAMIETASEFGG